jgi:hypothetical protein
MLTVQTRKRRDRPLAAPPPAARIPVGWCGKAGAGDRRRAANCSHPITDPNVFMIMDHFSSCRPLIGGCSILNDASPYLVTLPDQNSGRVLMLLRPQMVFFRQPRMLASSTGVVFCAGTRTTARKQHQKKGRKEQVYQAISSVLAEAPFHLSLLSGLWHASFWWPWIVENRYA